MNNIADDPFEETVIVPHFDERAKIEARPVVPITDSEESLSSAKIENISTESIHTGQTKSVHTDQTKKGPIKSPIPTAAILALALSVIAAGGISLYRSIQTEQKIIPQIENGAPPAQEEDEPSPAAIAKPVNNIENGVNDRNKPSDDLWRIGGRKHRGKHHGHSKKNGHSKEGHKGHKDD